MSFSFTGWGWVSFFLLALVVFLGFVSGLGWTGDWGWGSVIAAAFIAVGAGLNYLIGMAVNSTRTPTGRGWHNQSTLNGMPMQHASIAFLVFAWLGLAIAVGHWTRGFVGVVFFVVPLVIAAALALRAMRRVGPGTPTRQGNGHR